MKKLLLIAATIGIAASSNAQARLSLYEEFSGENCGPCAVSNPGLWSLMNTGTNPKNILLIKYQSPIPTAGPIYLAYMTVTDARLAYYGVRSAPNGRLNGPKLGTGTKGSAGHVVNLLQSDIDAETAAASPFNITTTAMYNATGDSVTTTVKVDCVTPYAPVGASMRLRIGMIEHLVYAKAPGNNGETDFHNVVREMYPDAGGTVVDNAWTLGMTKTYVIKGKVRSFVAKLNAPSMVAWLQNETDKSIPQASQSAPLPTKFPNDISSSVVSFPSTIACTGSTISTASITLKNSGTGTTPITAATIYYRIGTGAWSSQAWTGSLASGASATVTLGPITLPTTPGIYALTDSVVMTGAVDENVLDNTFSSPITVVSTAATPLAYSYDFEAAIPANWYFYSPDGSDDTWVRVNLGTSAKSGKVSAWFNIFEYASGTSSMIVFPTPTVTSSVSLDFWQAYAQQSTSNNDKLEVVYSKDCGVTWTSLWSAAGASLATTTPQPVTSTTTSLWAPSSATSSEWVKRSVSLNTVPPNSILAFRGTANGGNTMFIDDVNVRSGGVSIKEENTILNSFSISPNPATEFTNVRFNLTEATKVEVSLVDVVGKTVLNVANENMTSGAHEMKVNTSSLATGMYMIRIATNNGTITERVSVVK